MTEDHNDIVQTHDDLDGRWPPSEVIEDRNIGGRACSGQPETWRSSSGVDEDRNDDPERWMSCNEILRLEAPKASRRVVDTEGHRINATRRHVGASYSSEAIRITREAGMSGELQVDPLRLRDASRFAGEKARAIRDELKKLDDTIGKELLADGWQGKAATAYDESWVEWKHGADTVIAALEEVAAHLAQAATQYEMRDTTNRDAITGLTGLDLP
ncbi:WXG100 family type VII secretion target [Nocardia sp. NPDC057440]|uniref:WXG100 family type VII secretion target n=1 Tax=Nocardia sp. NPDC057440 TaxID=3346134 RepID=UPI00366B69B1